MDINYGNMKNEKALLFSCEKAARKSLRQETATSGVGHATPVPLSFRDLGNHLDSTRRSTVVLLTGMFRQATKLLREVTNMHLNHAQRVAIVRLKAFGMALYGAEVAQTDRDVMAGLVSAATDFLFPKAAWCRSTALSTLLVGGGCTLWLDTRILTLRVPALRRAVTKGPNTAADMKEALARHVAQRCYGTAVGDAELDGSNRLRRRGRRAGPSGWLPRGPKDLCSCCFISCTLWARQSTLMSSSTSTRAHSYRSLRGPCSV